VLMVWQSRHRNEWFTMVRDAVGVDPPVRTPDIDANDPFALAAPDTTAAVLAAGGFVDIGAIDVREPVYYGPDIATAYRFVTSMRHTRELLTHTDAATAERARRRLRVALAEHDTGNGVYVGSRAWIITARRG
jgi:hypothetical protein